MKNPRPTAKPKTETTGIVHTAQNTVKNPNTKPNTPSTPPAPPRALRARFLYNRIKPSIIKAIIRLRDKLKTTFKGVKAAPTKQAGTSPCELGNFCIIHKYPTKIGAAIKKILMHLNYRLHLRLGKSACSPYTRRENITAL